MAQDLEALARQFGGVPVDDGGDNLDALVRQHGGEYIHEPPKPLTAPQAVGAALSGFNRGAVEGLGGMPVDFALNVADLARAGYGYAGGKLGFLKPSELPSPLDRSQYVGSSAWIDKQLQRTPVTSALVTNPRADNPTARFLNAGGNAIGSSMAGTPGNIAMQFASGIAGQGAAEMGLPPSWQMLASMGPQTALTATQAATRGAMRGGEQGRQDMQQRTTDFENAGVTPTVGLATGRRIPQAIESTLSRAPGGAGTMARKAEDIRTQLQDTTNATRDQVSGVYGPVAAGDALRQGITGYRGRQQDIYGTLLERALNDIPEGMTFPVSSTLARGQSTLADIPGAPNVSRVVNAPLGFTNDVVGALRQDAAPKPPQAVPSPVLGPNGLPFTTQIPGTPGGIPIQGLRDLKTRIGQVAYAQNPLLADANQGAMRNLYGGAKQDLLTAGALADAQRVANGQPATVLNRFQRADRFYAQTQDVLDRVLKPVYNAGEGSSEGSYRRLESDARNSEQSVASTMSAMPLPVRQTVTATAIDRLGKASPGQQNAEGTQFSPQTFLTNWNKISPDAKTGLFSTLPNGSNVRTKLDYIAQAVDRINQGSKVYANPSGTAGAAAMLGQVAGLGSGVTMLATGHPVAGTGTLATILGTSALSRVGAWGMTNPKVVSWLADTTKIQPAAMNQHLRRLATMANLERDPQQKAAMQDLAQSLRNELAITQ